jgi:dTDP-4-amino-4,6-dideoxygalactose transaminase
MQLPSWPTYSNDEISAVADVLRSGKVNYWTGNNIKDFEQAFAGYCGADFAVAVANGSVGLGAALRATGIGDGDEVIVTPRSFFASAAEIELTGAHAVFADVDPESQNITTASIRAVLSPKTRCIVCVHLAGWPCDMPGIMQLADEHGLVVIEDCAQAHGAAVAGRRAGSWGHMGVFSFCQDKIMSTGGEGGMIVTSERSLYEQVWSYKDHGKGYAAVHSQSHPAGFRWLHECFGTNLRMTEMQAAIGLIQLSQLPAWLERRRRSAELLSDAFKDIALVRVPCPGEGVEHSYYKFYVFVNEQFLRQGWGRDRIIAEFSQAGIPGLSGSCPAIYREKAFASRDYSPLPVAEKLGRTSIMFEVHPTLEDEHINYLAETARRIFIAAQAE